MVESRCHFSSVTFVYQAAEDKPNGSCRIGSEVPLLGVRLGRCTVDQIKGELAKSNSYTNLYYDYFCCIKFKAHIIRRAADLI